MPLKRAKLNCTEGWMHLLKEMFALLCVWERERKREMQERTFYKGTILVFFSGGVRVCARVCVYMYVYGGGRDGEQTWLTVWISSCCKSASVTDGRPLIAGLWRLGSHRRRKSLSVSLGGREGEGWGWGRLGSHQSLSPVCVDIEAWVFKGEDWFGEGLSYFYSAVVSSTTLWELVSGT